MAISEHTPGPWVVNDTVHGPGNGIVHIQYNDPFEQDICTVWGASLDKPEQHVANALLIAAAPELLAALKAMVERVGPRWFLEQNWVAPLDAIEKAEGRS